MRLFEVMLILLLIYFKKIKIKHSHLCVEQAQNWCQLPGKPGQFMTKGLKRESMPCQQFSSEEWVCWGRCCFFLLYSLPWGLKTWLMPQAVEEGRLFPQCCLWHWFPSTFISTFTSWSLGRAKQPGMVLGMVLGRGCLLSTRGHG